ncbi:MAG: hypothetical protein Q8K70_02950 [Bacteroidota bacterium]|nr:hypothetical protein [Bacteroidota bacterium]
MNFKVVKIRDFVGHRQSVYCLCFDPLNRHIYSSGGDGMLVRWKTDEDDGLLIAKNDSAIFSILYHDDKIFAGSNNGEIIVIDAVNHQIITKLKLNNHPIYDIQNDSNKIYIATGDGQIISLNYDYQIESALKISNKSIRKLSITPNGFIIAGSEPAVWKFDKNWLLIQKWVNFNSSVFSLLYLDSINMILSGGRDALIYFHTDNDINNETIKAHLLHINDMQANHNENLILTASMDKTIKLWDIRNRVLLKVIDKEKYDGHTSSVNKIIWINENTFISCSDDRTLKCFEVNPIE